MRLTLRDLSLLAGGPLGTVKVRLHRARTSLRQAFGREDTVRKPLFLGEEKEAIMVEVTVHVQSPVNQQQQQPPLPPENLDGQGAALRQ